MVLIEGRDVYGMTLAERLFRDRVIFHDKRCMAPRNSALTASRGHNASSETRTQFSRVQNSTGSRTCGWMSARRSWKRAGEFTTSVSNGSASVAVTHGIKDQRDKIARCHRRHRGERGRRRFLCSHRAATGCCTEVTTFDPARRDSCLLAPPPQTPARLHQQGDEHEDDTKQSYGIAVNCSHHQRCRRSFNDRLCSSAW